MGNILGLLGIPSPFQESMAGHCNDPALFFRPDATKFWTGLFPGREHLIAHPLNFNQQQSWMLQAQCLQIKRGQLTSFNLVLKR